MNHLIVSCQRTGSTYFGDKFLGDLYNDTPVFLNEWASDKHGDRSHLSFDRLSRSYITTYFSDTIFIHKLFGEHVTVNNPAVNNFQRHLFKYTNKFYFLYRKDVTAQIYSLLHAKQTGVFQRRKNVGAQSELVDIDIDGWVTGETVIKHNYDYMLEFANNLPAHSDVDIICLEEDLPHEPYYSTAYYTDDTFKCSFGTEYHEKFQALKKRFVDK